MGVPEGGRERRRPRARHRRRPDRPARHAVRAGVRSHRGHGLRRQPAPARAPPPAPGPPRRTGATRTVTPDDELDGDYDALIECSGHPGALTAGIKALRPAGTAVLVGMGPGEEGTLPLSVIQGREIWLTGTFRYANTYPTAIALAATGRVDLKAIMSQRFGLDETDAALRAGREDPESVKPLVLP